MLQLFKSKIFLKLDSSIFVPLEIFWTGLKKYTSNYSNCISTSDTFMDLPDLTCAYKKNERNEIFKNEKEASRYSSKE